MLYTTWSLPVICLGIIVTNIAFKYYCLVSSVFENKPLSAIILVNLFGCVQPWLIIGHRRFLSVLSSQWYGERGRLLVSSVKGFTSFINFYFYWNYAERFLKDKHIAFAVVFNQLANQLINWGHSDLVTELIFKIPSLLVEITKLRLLWYDENKEAFRESGANTDAGSDYDTKVRRQKLVDKLWRAFFWVALPRLMTYIVDCVYAKFSGGVDDARVDLAITSTTTTLLAAGYLFYLNLTEGYSEPGTGSLMSLMLLFMGSVKNESRTLNNFITTRLGPDSSIAADKIAWWSYPTLVNLLHRDSNVWLEIASMFARPRIFFLIDSLLMFSLIAARLYVPSQTDMGGLWLFLREHNYRLRSSSLVLFSLSIVVHFFTTNVFTQFLNWQYILKVASRMITVSRWMRLFLLF